MLYPLKFKPLWKERIWGGDKIATVLGKKFDTTSKIGECWELSGVQGSLSVVSNGYLCGNNIEELVEVYMGDLVGEKVYEQFGVEFPVLIKIIDATDVLSIQVHPNDALAAARHKAYGKTEMWYVVSATDDAEIYLGFRAGIDRATYLHHLEQGTLSQILNKIDVQPNTAYIIPAGTIHAIGKGVMLVEIQQTSDITYRVFDWNRVDEQGNKRELHSDLALEALDFEQSPEDFNLEARWQTNTPVALQSCPYFTTNLLSVDGSLQRDYYEIDSFVTYVCLEGSFELLYPEGRECMHKGDTVLIPAELKEISLVGQGRVMETYVP